MALVRFVCHNVSVSIRRECPSTMASGALGNAWSARVRALRRKNFTQMSTRFDREYGVYWAYMNCSSPRLLHARALVGASAIPRCNRCLSRRIPVTARQPFAMGSSASKTQGVYSNSGGDFALFRRYIETAGSRSAWSGYGERVRGQSLPVASNCDLPMTSMALGARRCAGRRLRGGAIGERCSSPKSRLGWGSRRSYSTVSRTWARSASSAEKWAGAVADEMITSGTVYPARQLYDMGVVDVLTSDGTGEQAVYVISLRRHAKGGQNGRRGYERARNEVGPVTREELTRIVDIWADTALARSLSDRDLRMMERLVRAQQRVPEPSSRALGKVVSIT